MKKIILITGASSGMGKAFALRLLKEGHMVYGAARRTERMQDILEAGGHVVTMDVTDASAMRTGLDRILAEQGRIDVLINNAGYAIYGSVEETSMEDVHRQFEVNIFGLGQLTQLVIPHMRAQGSGRIVNISSMGGRMYTPLGAWYHATKHALEGWSDCLRLELAPLGIDVVIIEPGIIKTEFAEVMTGPLLKRSGMGPYGELARRVAKGAENGMATGRGSDPDVVADLVVKAVRARRPRTRYAGGFLARPVMWMRKWGGDRLFDRVIMKAA
ncbi:MAG: SDR family NAD(P)-dependent oxidoreductase [Flavobacteriales bacterium]|nr:SDR family NAD(P)-dependent oxidoreductase [Flavobacteriales bacterium]